jgi:hypothetical protein
MIARTRTAMKFFTYGLVIGLLFAPRSGKETRGRIISWASDTAKSLLGE